MAWCSTPGQTRVTLASPSSSSSSSSSASAPTTIPRSNATELALPRIAIRWDPVWEACGVEWTGCPEEKPCDDLDVVARSTMSASRKKIYGFAGDSVVCCQWGICRGDPKKGDSKRGSRMKDSEGTVEEVLREPCVRGHPRRGVKRIFWSDPVEEILRGSLRGHPVEFCWIDPKRGVF
ncbi:hypothetical protein LWI29_000328 [Acer saccharum]|uniref:Uncharacterized protein n=1 Tax=Acer saccharum TaxID=4024 RepID=A0AA39RTD6_ACESA|nr:hypothetical protein LWI29_000328 [Acer saccharum]